jgi:hypothetical protein
MDNITYLFGAGASYNACPIWKEQGAKMMELSEFLGLKFSFTDDEGCLKRDYIDQIAWEIGYIGYKASEFNTVDTYARKLYLLKDKIQLQKLKMAVSTFFTLWALTKDKKWKQLRDGKGNTDVRMNDIDPRYINLLATYLNTGEPNPILSSNVKFVTWNYDLQIEAAYNKFCIFKENELHSVNHYFPFISIPDSNKDLVVCHLNGFSGFYGQNNHENLFNRSDSNELRNLLNSFDFLNKPSSNKPSFGDFINYAWETNSEYANEARLKAIEIFSKTNILVIVGYSFPPFNHSIDKQLFESIKNLKRIIYQDPNADPDFLSETFGIPKNKIVIINKSMDQFSIPNYKEKEARFLE